MGRMPTNVPREYAAYSHCFEQFGKNCPFTLERVCPVSNVVASCFGVKIRFLAILTALSLSVRTLPTSGQLCLLLLHSSQKNHFFNGTKARKNPDRRR